MGLGRLFRPGKDYQGTPQGKEPLRYPPIQQGVTTEQVIHPDRNFEGNPIKSVAGGDRPQTINVPQIYPGAPVVDPTQKGNEQPGTRPGSRYLPNSPLIGPNMPFIKDFHSLTLTTDTNPFTFQVTFLPDFWLVVARLSAGWINVSIGVGQGAVQFRLQSGSLRLPIWAGNPSLSINTVGASGIYDVYAVKNAGDVFDVEA